MSHGLFKRARLGCALLCLWVWWPLLAGADECVPEHFDEIVSVDRIYDGDTVRLNDGRRLRLIGIDAPEIFHDRNDAEPFARDAKEALSALIEQGGGRIRLTYDRERRDRYSRYLAHAFTDGDESASISADLLMKGLAISLVVPPNVRFLDCYRAAETKAREAGEGIWGDEAYNPIEGIDVPASIEGFRIVTGKVERVGESRTSLWINLEGGIALRIDRDDLENFPGTFSPETLVEKQVTARGKVYRHRGQNRMRIAHPADLTVEE